MKKIITTAALVTAMSLPMTAFSQEVVNLGTVGSGSNQIAYGTAANQCVLLAETVSVNVSNNVSGAYRCSEAFGTARIATCHSSGSRTGTTVDCAFTADPEGTDEITDADGNAITGSWNGDTCQQVADGEPPMTFEVSTRRYYYAASSGGSVSLRALEEGAGCGSDALTTVVQQ